MKPTIAVTGASGHIGNVLCRKLVEQGFSVRAFYHSDARSLEGVNVELVKGDVLNLDDLTKLIDGCEIVINCAAIITIHGDPDGIVFKTNTHGPKNVLEVCQKFGVKKIIHVSSTHAVEELPWSEPFDETRPYKTRKADSYDYSKALGEQLMLQLSKGNPEVVVVRPSSVVGPFDFKPSEMGKALIDFYKEKIPALPQGGYNFVDVRDVSQSIINAIESGKSGEVYLVTGKYYSLKNLAAIIKKVSGKKVTQMVIPFWLLRISLPLITLYSKITGGAPVFTLSSIKALKNGHPYMNYTKAAVALGHQPRPIEESIHDFYEWQRKRKIIGE